MSLFRAFAIAFTLLVSPSVASVAFAGCWGCGPQALGPAFVAPVGPGPVFPWAGCGGACIPGPALFYQIGSTPVAVAPDPIAVDHWDTNGFGDCRFPGDYFGACGWVARCGWFSGPGPCGGPVGCGGGCGRPVAYWPAPSRVYIVNRGPEYSGPGIMIPFKTYSPTTGLAAPREFPYISVRRHFSHPPLAVRG
jgi:hypothetical protein